MSSLSNDSPSRKAPARDRTDSKSRADNNMSINSSTNLKRGRERSNTQDSDIDDSKGSHSRTHKRSPRDNNARERDSRGPVRDIRPSRRVFMNNLSYKTTQSECEKFFKQCGSIVDFFLIPEQGICFCTYDDIRSATRAVNELTNQPLLDRIVNVTYSLPRKGKDGKFNEKENATLYATLGGYSGVLDDKLASDFFEEYGEIRSIRTQQTNRQHKYIEFYRITDAEKALAEGHDREYLGGKWILFYAHFGKKSDKERRPYYDDHSRAHNRDRDRDRERNRDRDRDRDNERDRKGRESEKDRNRNHDRRERGVSDHSPRRITSEYERKSHRSPSPFRDVNFERNAKKVRNEYSPERERFDSHSTHGRNEREFTDDRRYAHSPPRARVATRAYSPVNDSPKARRYSPRKLEPEREKEREREHVREKDFDRERNRMRNGEFDRERKERRNPSETFRDRK